MSKNAVNILNKQASSRLTSAIQSIEEALPALKELAASLEQKDFTEKEQSLTIDLGSNIFTAWGSITETITLMDAITSIKSD